MANTIVEWRSLSAIFVDEVFYELVLTLESGYFHALKNPALLAAYMY